MAILVAFNIYYSILTLGCILAVNVRSRSQQVHIIRLFLIFTFCSESISRALAYLHENNLLINNIWLIIAPTLFIYVLCSKERSSLSKLKFVLPIAYLSICLINLFYGQGFNTFNTYSAHFATITMLILIFFNLRYFFINPDTDIALDPFFWILIGLFFFYVGGFLVNVAMNYSIVIDISIASQLFIIRNLVNIISYTMLSAALLIDLNNRKKKLSSNFEL